MRAVKLLFLILLLNPTSSATASADIERPISPVVYAGSTGEFELYWFWPGVHRQRLGNVENYIDHHGCLGIKEYKYALLTKFQIDPPILVDSVLTFIANSLTFRGPERYSPGPGKLWGL